MVPNAGPDTPDTRHECIIWCADEANPFLSVIRMAWWWQPLKTEGSQCLECLCEWEWKIVATELLCGFTRFPCTAMCNTLMHFAMCIVRIQCAIIQCALQCHEVQANDENLNVVRRQQSVQSVHIGLDVHFGFGHNDVLYLLQCSSVQTLSMSP